MVIPLVAARVKKPDKFPRDGVDAREVWPFGGIAEKAGKGKVPRYSPATVLLCGDVVDFKWHVACRLGKVAVLAAIPGPLTDQLAKGFIHYWTRASRIGGLSI